MRVRGSKGWYLAVTTHHECDSAISPSIRLRPLLASVTPPPPGPSPLSTHLPCPAPIANSTGIPIKSLKHLIGAPLTVPGHTLGHLQPRTGCLWVT